MPSEPIKQDSDRESRPSTEVTATIEVTAAGSARAAETEGAPVAEGALRRTLAEVQERLRLALEAAAIERECAAAERAHLTAALAHRKEELDRFIYIVSHDLRAPLRGIANLSSWMEEDLDGKLDEEGREQMRLLRGRVHRLEAMIDGILRYSRAGRAGEPIEAVDLGALVAEVLAKLAPAAAVSFDVAPGMPTIETERAPLLQVLSCLVSNALKHAGRPDPRVAVTCVEAGSAYEITVKDDGQGIPISLQPRVWGIFQTLAPRDEVEGTGIGLSIVKKIVESRGGRVWIESAPKAGAAFHFTWPKRERGPGG
jgi:light-regulated signal transduction histidine kinase (bacteriophytochrome)